MAFDPARYADDYLGAMASACGSDTAAAPRPDELDNTRHVGSCSAFAAPVVVGCLFVLFVLRRVVCGATRLRQTYSGSEDAPELEEIVASDGGRAGRRVDGYSVGKAGRLVSGARAVRSGSTISGGAPRPKKKRGSADQSPELEPVLWRR